MRDIDGSARTDIFDGFSVTEFVQYAKSANVSIWARNLSFGQQTTAKHFGIAWCRHHTPQMARFGGLTSSILLPLHRHKCELLH